MSDVGLIFSPLDYLVLALLFGSPDLAIGAGVGAFAWRRHRIIGAVTGAAIGTLLCLAGAYLKMLLDWLAQPTAAPAAPRNPSPSGVNTPAATAPRRTEC